MTAQRIFYEGKVQGVGFRWTVKRLATGYDVTGWVRNLTDGRVELLAMGEAVEVQAFLDGIAESELKANIRHVSVSDTEPDREARGFLIRD